MGLQDGARSATAASAPRMEVKENPKFHRMDSRTALFTAGTPMVFDLDPH